MSKDLNNCTFIGRLGNEVDMRYTAGGKAIANLSIACSDDYKNKDTGEKVEQTNWIRIVAFGRLAEIMGEYLRKGSQVYISGKQVTRKWEDKDGKYRYTTEIEAKEMQMLGVKGEAAPQQQAAPDKGYTTEKTPAPQPESDDFLDDIPF